MSGLEGDVDMAQARSLARREFLRRRASETKKVQSNLLQQDERAAFMAAATSAPAAPPDSGSSTAALDALPVDIADDLARRRRMLEVVDELATTASGREVVAGVTDANASTSLQSSSVDPNASKNRPPGCQLPETVATALAASAQPAPGSPSQIRQKTGFLPPVPTLDPTSQGASSPHAAARSEDDIANDRRARHDDRRAAIEAQRRSLPVAKVRSEFLRLVEHNQVVVVVGETGSGKTTQLPQYLCDAGYTKVACTQPRRLAATSVAERVAVERNVRLGQQVGYNVRFDNRSSDRTDILFLTDGMMLKEFLKDPLLTDFKCIMIDEAHERSVSTDILLGILRDVIRSRKDLRIVVASATIESEKFVAFFDQCPVFRISGRTFPVDVNFVGDPVGDYVEAAASMALQVHLDEPLPGDILIFMPGQDDIERCTELLEAGLSVLNAEAGLDGKVRGLIVLPVYSSLPIEQQRLIYQRTPEGTRKVVIATNIAETSITVDGIVYVIDTGLCKQKLFHPKTRLESLDLVPISRASAEQRKGRAGRTQAGKCIRLYTKFMYENELEKEPVPEMLRSSLTAIMLNLKALGIHNPLAFDFLDAPSADAVVEALEELHALGAVTNKGSLSKTGRRMAELPVDPALARCLIASLDEPFRCAKEMVIVASMLSLQNSVFITPKDKRDAAMSARRRFFTSPNCSDITGYVRLFLEWEARGGGSQAGGALQWCRSNFVSSNVMQRARDVRAQLANAMALLNVDGEDALPGRDDLFQGGDLVKADELLSKCFAVGYFQNSAKLAPDGLSYQVLTRSRSRTGAPFGTIGATVTSAQLHPTCAIALHEQLWKQEQQQRELRIALAEEDSGVSSGKGPVGGSTFQRPAFVIFGEIRQTAKTFLVHVAPITAEVINDVSPEGFFAPEETSTKVARKRVR